MWIELFFFVYCLLLNVIVIYINREIGNFVKYFIFGVYRCINFLICVFINEI